jgi:hypothetical protein
MNVVAAAMDRLYVALSAVDGLRAVRGVGNRFDPPAVVIGLPSTTYGGMGVEPTDATFTVAVAVAFSERYVDELLSWTPIVEAALYGVENAAVRSTSFGSVPAGGVDLPANLIQVEMGLI